MHIEKRTQRLAGFGLALSALGIVYGDIGTSPLYAINEIFIAHHTEATRESVLGAISLVVWALTMIVTCKYVSFVLRADNQGEGGVFALLSQIRTRGRRYGKVVAVLLVVAAGLLFGDGLITPAISVLSAVEGLKVAAPSLGRFVVPITIVILTSLFAVQHKGTHKVGRVFGPLILVWFAAMGVLGISQIMHAPGILAALNPWHALRYLTHTPLRHLLRVLGSVILVVTGGEALYADMGHFGKRPIRLSWFSVAYPMLLLGYLGQGAFLLSGSAVKNGNIFFSMVPTWALFPMIILATCATIIASQALISGAFSLATQGIGLKLLPRLKIIHTHAQHEGQIYVPAVNWLLYAGCVTLVIAFGSSSRLAGAYGLAVAADMVITSLAMIIITRAKWNWGWPHIAAIFGTFLAIDLTFLGANSIKLLEGGYIPLTIALIAYIIMTTWRWGREHIRSSYERQSTMTMQALVNLRTDSQWPVFPRSLLLLTPSFAEDQDALVPPLLQLFLDRYHALPRHIVTLTVTQVRKPHVPKQNRYEMVTFENNPTTKHSIISIRANFGFMETPNIKTVINDIAANDAITPGDGDELKDWIIYVGKERITASPEIRRAHYLRYKLFHLLARNAEPTYNYYGLGDDLRLSMEVIPVKVN
jgi:KUP system potassium uptake protein